MNQAAKAINLAVAADVYQFHRALLARLKTHGHAAGNVQALAVGGFAVKRQARVRLCKVVVGADLNRPVAGVLHHQRGHSASGVEFVSAFVQQ